MKQEKTLRSEQDFFVGGQIMGHLDNAPTGAPEASMSRNRKGMLERKQPSGWRKVTTGLLAAEHHASSGEPLAVPKSKAFVAVKRIGAHIGLKASDMMLLDTLGAFTQPQDWEEGRRPIVWASNAFLMEQTGFSLSSLKRHTRKLAEAGVIAFHDSPNGKRWGRRDSEGVIIEAYGIDLSPLSARTTEFEQMYSDLKIERGICQRLKRQITVTRRMIRARIETAMHEQLHGPWANISAMFETLLQRLPRSRMASNGLQCLLVAFQDLYARVETLLTDATHQTDLPNAQGMDPKEAINDPHIQTTNKLNSVNGSCSETDTIAKTSQQDRMDEPTNDHNTSNTVTASDLRTIIQACPEFRYWADNMNQTLTSWRDLHRVAGQLAPMIGVPIRVWNLAQERLGSQDATAALVLVFEKHCAGQVASPSGYLRGMIKKARNGKLHLRRSFYGRLGALAS